MTQQRTDLGHLAEDLAARHLIQEGYGILVRNYRNLFGEIDLIAKDGDTLCFIEVRSRTQDSHGHPFESVSLEKQKKIIRVAQGYLVAQDNDDIEARFDVVAVTPDDGEYFIEIIKNAFEVE